MRRHATTCPRPRSLAPPWQARPSGQPRPRPRGGYDSRPGHGDENFLTGGDGPRWPELPPRMTTPRLSRPRPRASRCRTPPPCVAAQPPLLHPQPLRGREGHGRTGEQLQPLPRLGLAPSRRTPGEASPRAALSPSPPGRWLALATARGNEEAATSAAS